MSLKEYDRKRDFHKTPEPPAKVARKRARKLKFVIQKHDASRLHYDFRLEWDGVLKSWAVPKGPSLDPSKRQLAVQVEDHPLAYGTFEGIIPKGEYGGGTVLLWDTGEWIPRDDAAKDLKAGKIKFELHGEKLTGGWTLVRMSGEKNEDGKNWLLIKERDEFAKAGIQRDITVQKPLSVSSGRDLPEIAADKDKVWKSKPKQSKTVRAEKRAGTAKKSSVKRVTASQNVIAASQLMALEGAVQQRQPAKLKPQLATLGDAVPAGDDWLHEMKFDGYRLLARIRDGKVQLITRNGNDWTSKFPLLSQELLALPLDQGILDGELVVLREDGTPDFQLLQNSLKSGDEERFIYYVFDAPWIAGFNLKAVRQIDRKQIVEQILLAHSPSNDGMVRYSAHVQGQGQEMATLACHRKLEGIISKRADAPYESARSRSWIKSKCLKRQEFVIGGYTKPSGGRQKFGSLLLGIYDGGQLKYCGKVGTGFTEASLKDVSKQLQAQTVEESPFVSVPTAIKRQLQQWIEPTLVAEVEFTEWTSDGRLRHPSFKGLRSDKPAAEIIREEAMDTPAKPLQNKAASKKVARQQSAKDSTVADIEITHPERIVFPDDDITKLHIAAYYEKVEKWVLPHLAERPLSLVRCPGGIAGECFFQKHFDVKLPKAVKSVAIKEKSKTDDYAWIEDVSGIVVLVQYGVLEFHPWPARVDDVEHPDFLVFDFDPGEESSWQQVVDGARDIRQRLRDLKLESFVRTSGGKGLHVVVPIARRTSWDEAKAFAGAMAEAMAGDAPQLYTANMNKQKRVGKVFVDYHRNGRGATAIGSYCTRARPGAPVATPLRWEELGKVPAANHFTVNNLPQRLARLRSDPWAEFFEVRQGLTQPLLRKVVH